MVEIPSRQAGVQNLARTGGRQRRSASCIVEDASRFARHLLTQEAGIALLVGLGVRVFTAAGDDLTRFGR